MTIREILTEGKRRLGVPSPLCFIDTPDLDASLLLAKVLRCRREELIVCGNENANDEDRECFYSLLERRRNGESIAYILGRKEFRGLDFAVNPHVLVPRPDTEILFEAALEYIDSRAKQKDNRMSQLQNSVSFATGFGETTQKAGFFYSSKVVAAKTEVLQQPRIISLLDLCTGSGALAICLKNERPFVEVSASDISPRVLETAVKNAGRLLDEGLSAGKPKTVRFIQSDLFAKIPEKFDIIVSNPPYIPSGEIASLAPEVRGEPRLALDGGGDGLDLIKKIAARAKNHLKPAGALLLEADPRQMPAIRSLLLTHGFGGIAIRKDLAGRERVISGTAN